VSLVLVLDGYTKKIVGYDAGVPCTARHGLAALDMAVSRQFPRGEFRRLTSREVSPASPYSTFSHMSMLALFSAVDVHLFPSKTNDRGTKVSLNWIRPASTVTGVLRV
jgi:hypothetical protein